MVFFLAQAFVRQTWTSSALSQLIGLTDLKKLARLYIKACRRADITFPHTLLWGIGGTGKTVFARAIGQDLRYYFVEFHAADFKSRQQLYGTLRDSLAEAQQAGKPLLFFLDEVHRLSTGLQEALYTVMAEWWIPTKEGRLDISHFTLVGATTRYDMLDANSFVTRMKNKWQITRYDLNEMREIVTFELVKISRTLHVKPFCFGRKVTREIAQRCLGIPRNAVSLVEQIALQAIADNKRRITVKDCQRMFGLSGIDGIGLGKAHHEYLNKLAESRVNGSYVPIGIGAISGKLRLAQDVVVGSIEPILLELDFVASTPRGRILTKKGADFLEN